MKTNTTANEIKLIEIIRSAIDGLAKGRNPHVVKVRESMQFALGTVLNTETVAVKNAEGGYDSVPVSTTWEAMAMNNDDGRVVRISTCEATSEIDARRKMANWIGGVWSQGNTAANWTVQISPARSQAEINKQETINHQ